MKFSDLTRSQKAALASNPEAKEEAFKLEAIDRGIAVPLSIPEQMDAMRFTGFQIPASATRIYEVCITKGYGDNRPTGLCFTSQDAAEKAVKGSLAVYETGYGENAHPVIADSEATITCRHVSLVKQGVKVFTLDAYENESKAFSELCDELCKEIQGILQEDYDTKINQQKKASYLELAKWDEDIARGFWAKIERGPWPENENPATVPDDLIPLDDPSLDVVTTDAPQEKP